MADWHVSTFQGPWLMTLRAVATVMMAALVALMGLNVVNTGVGDTGRITENGICDK